MTRDELEKLAGEPTEIDTFNASGDEDEYLTESWHYDDDEFSVSFDEEDNWKLTTISSSSENSVLGEKLIGKKIDDVLSFLEKMDLGENELEDLSDENINQKLVSYLRASLNLWFENDILSEIQWGVLWSDEDTPNWP